MRSPPPARVMSFIEKTVARLDQEDKLEKLALELGRSHCRYKAPPKYYEVRRPQGCLLCLQTGGARLGLGAHSALCN